MTNTPIIFILEDQQQKLQLIKEQARRYHPNCLFITANDQSSFEKKINWLRPDMIIASLSAPDYIGLEAFHYMEAYKWYTPFIYVADDINIHHLIQKTVLQLADSYVFIHQLHQLHDQIRNVVNQNQDQVIEATEKYKESSAQFLALQKREELALSTVTSSQTIN
ncbi:MAG: hypothetical protein AAGI23_01220 [Bacteroidota bacterium]